MATETRYFDCTPASSTQLGEWVQVEISDPPVRPVTLGDIVVTHLQSGEVLPHAIVANTVDRLRFAVGLRSPSRTTETQRIRVVITDTSEAHPGYLDWVSGGITNSGDYIGPVVPIIDGLGATSPSSPDSLWVHPNVLRVPDTSWMRFKDAAERDAGVGTVTHIRIDTPYPPADSEQYENPYLLYSTDDGWTWHEWRTDWNPINPWPGAGHYTSDPCFTFKADGSLYCLFNSTQGRRARVVTGTHLGDATPGAAFAPTMVSGWSPSIIQVEGVWYCFQRVTGGSVTRQQSVDEGVTWTDSTLAIMAQTTDGGSLFTRSYWHGSVVGPFADGYYYATFSENAWGNANMGNGNVRLFRALNPLDGSWQAARNVTLRYGGSGSIAASTWYQPVLFQRTDGSVAVMATGLSAGNTYRAAIHNLTIAPSAVPQYGILTPQRLSFTWGNDEAAAYAVDNTDRGTVTEVTNMVAEYRAEYSTNAGADWTVAGDWTADLSVALDTDTLPDGPLMLRVQARDAAEPTDVSGYDTVSLNVGNIEYRVTYQEDGGVETIAQDWTANDLSESIDTTALADGPLTIRVYARDTDVPADIAVSTRSLTVANGAPVGVTIQPAFIASGATVYAPTLSEGAGPVTVQPAFIASTAQVFAPRVIDSAAVAPANAQNLTAILTLYTELEGVL